ncbi:MAG: 4-alpha-glucanotransferase [Clostridiales bacterium]|nr:4-alpha-glucanotransferase [Clostridiales bacterium]
MRIKKQKPMLRGAGVLLPVSCLPSPYGIGTFGADAYEFVDFLRSAGQKYWQVLPLGPTSYGDSPYQSFSAFAGNPYYIDLDLLIKEGLLTNAAVSKVDWGKPAEVDYALLYEKRLKLLRTAFKKSRHSTAAEYTSFCSDNEGWLRDYCLYMAVKNHFGEKAWTDWPEKLRAREPEAMKEIALKLGNEMDFWCFCQYKFFEQWFKLKEYANSNGIEIIGDIPIYVALDSADVWANPKLFDLDVSLRPRNVAGVPPDMFSKTGQLWGNPLYDWSGMEKEDYVWWKARISISAHIFDIIRIDHFIGIVNYFAIPADRADAKSGVWLPGPGERLVSAINSAIGDKRIIAEDLGNVTPKVRALLAKSGYPGMKLLEMAFDSGSGNENLPHHYEKNCVAFGGTHDNETLKGFFAHQNTRVLKYAREYLEVKTNREIPWAIVRAAYRSNANTVVFAVQDIIGLDNKARINTPSTMGGNWKWRLVKGQLTERHAHRLKKLVEVYGR